MLVNSPSLTWSVNLQLQQEDNIKHKKYRRNTSAKVLDFVGIIPTIRYGHRNYVYAIIGENHELRRSNSLYRRNTEIYEKE